jgi:hypothetical protein
MRCVGCASAEASSSLFEQSSESKRAQPRVVYP